jgi:hypothetical protein
MNRFNIFVLAMLMGVSAPALSTPKNYCIAVNGGWGSTETNGTTFVGKGIEYPLKGACQPWFGIVRTSLTVVGTSHGSICLSNDGKLLTVSLTSTLPEYLGLGRAGVAIDHIELCPGGNASCPAHSGQSDRGELANPVGATTSPAKHITCTSAMAAIPSSHD